jgi:PAS domain S-box-containing protein
MVERVGVSDAIHFAFASNPLALSVSTVDGRFVEVNDACARLFGRPAADFLGRSWQEINPDGDVEEAAQAFGAVIGGASDVAALRIVIRRPDGTEVPAELRGRLVRDAQGRPLWFVNEFEPR